MKIWKIRIEVKLESGEDRKFYRYSVFMDGYIYRGVLVKDLRTVN
jgi:hypothetical protein